MFNGKVCFLTIVRIRIGSTVVMKYDECLTFFNKLQLDSCPWKEHKADTGRIYYHNTETKESTWTIPKELAELKGKLISYSLVK